jgi:hypothetical protein
MRFPREELIAKGFPVEQVLAGVIVVSEGASRFAEGWSQGRCQENGRVPRRHLRVVNDDFAVLLRAASKNGHVEALEKLKTLSKNGCR